MRFIGASTYLVSKGTWNRPKKKYKWDLLDDFHKNKSEYPYTFGAVLQAVGISKQGFHQHHQHQKLKEVCLAEMIPWMDSLRLDQEDIGIRKAYYTLLFNDFDLPVGRDQFEAYFIEKGYQLAPKPSFKPETTKRGAYYAPNLVADLKVTNVNQVYLSDSSYWWIAPRWVYFTTLMDVYSRRLLGLICSEGLSAEETVIPAINAALTTRGSINLTGCFMHSDKGGQYIDGNFKGILEQWGMISSMASNVYENPHIESVNQSIKRFLRAKEIKTYASFVSACASLQQIYNHKRLHDGLLPHRQTPISYEALIATLNPEDRPVLILPPMCNKY